MMRFTRIGDRDVPVMGQGTWQLGDRRDRRAREIEALRAGIDLGLTLIDTAEMYGNGAAEELVAEAIEGRRDEVYLVTKILPGNATGRRQIVARCEASLRRLRTDRIDLYLLHWRSGEDLPATVATFEALVQAGKIGAWGVSNFGVEDLDELERLPGGTHVACNQVLYNLTRRGIEFDLLPRARRRGLTVMAYTPIEQARILGHAVLTRVAARHGATPAQVALAWVLRAEGVIAIPRSGSAEHVRDNAAALQLTLSEADLSELDAAFPAPKAPRPLEML